MGLIQRVFQREEADVEASYAPLEGGSEHPDGERIPGPEQREYSRTDYYVFLLLGVAMLWAWYVHLMMMIYLCSNTLQEHVPRSSSLLPTALRVR